MAEIRIATPADRRAIHALLQQAFENSEEADLVDNLRSDGEMALEMVAVDGERIIGHIAYSQVQAPVWALALAPLSVAPPYQRRGVGSRLLRSSLRYLLEKGWEAVFVLGDPEFYEKHGFSAATARPFNSDYEGPNFMALELKPQCLAKHHGDIRHAAAFGKLA